MGNRRNGRKKKASTSRGSPEPEPAPKKQPPKPRPAYKGAAKTGPSKSQQNNILIDEKDLDAAEVLAALRDVDPKMRAVSPASQSEEVVFTGVGKVSAAERSARIAAGSRGSTEEIGGDTDEDEDEPEEEEEELEDNAVLPAPANGSRKYLSDRLVDQLLGVMEKRSSKKKKRSTTPSGSEPESEGEEVYKIAFKVPCGTAKKEVKIFSDSSWSSARRQLADGMGCEAHLIQVAYTLPWEQKGSKKVAPTILQNDDEWDSLREQIHAHIKAEKAKNHGRGTVKPFSIVLDKIGDSSTPQQLNTKSGGPGSGQRQGLDDAQDHASSPTGKVIEELQTRYFCAACKKPCVVLPPGDHRHLTIKALGKWAFLIAAGKATLTEFPKHLIPDLGLPVQPVASAHAEPASASAPSAAATPSAAAPSALQLPLPQVSPSTPQALLQMLMGALNPYTNSPLAPLLPSLAAASAPTLPAPMFSFPVPPSLPYGLPPMPNPYGAQYAIPAAHFPTSEGAVRNNIPLTPRRRSPSIRSRSPATPLSGRRRRSEESSPGDARHVSAAPAYNPTLAEWLPKLDADPERGQDQQHYTQYLPSFSHLDLIRLDDLTPLSTNDLCSLIPGMSVGVAGRLLRWAVEDCCAECVGREKRRRYH